MSSAKLFRLNGIFLLLAAALPQILCFSLIWMSNLVYSFNTRAAS